MSVVPGPWPARDATPADHRHGPAESGTDQDGLALLLREVAEGDQEAFAQLYDASARRVFGLALRVLQNASHAEEVAQEVYAEAWTQAARFDPQRGSGLTWLLTLTHRRAVDRVRATQAATRRDESYGLRALGREFDSTAEQVEGSLEAQRVRAGLASLGTSQREAIELAYFGGHTHTEVADLLQIPLGTAKSRIRDGLHALRDTMGGIR